ncbi:uncharacterized protein N7515_003821 [Penicillium bovifimosum]|uniref:Uncharacterized protein n=1 Tax=Penicillium bovifimosum TaxID=126998 RepID=A0A9W9L520_9EURO|nr:uncharacterized protein N7515_003821 [Penicillium bovifimosum]KAJ5138973.1 hypothetical protein N7515_003821 [Penicillium bovifimosum]
MPSLCNIEPHAEPHATLPSVRQSKMKIDALLNPGDSQPPSPPSHPTSPTTTTTRLNYPQQPLPSLPASPGDYWYSSPGSPNQTLPIHGSNPNQHQMFLTYRNPQPHSTMTLNQKSSHSAPCSPDMYRSQRFPSVSSSSSAGEVGDRRRPPRPKYEEEEMYFIWYHRVDLCQEWKEVREAFNRQFSARQRRGFQGIQCKFYRFIKEKKCPTLREQRRMRDGEFLREGVLRCRISRGDISLGLGSTVMFGIHG